MVLKQLNLKCIITFVNFQFMETAGAILIQ